jgi:hypothetical protein
MAASVYTGVSLDKGNGSQISQDWLRLPKSDIVPSWLSRHMQPQFAGQMYANGSACDLWSIRSPAFLAFAALLAG